MPHACRHCGSPLEHTVIDLGHQPPSNAYLTADQLLKPEITYPLQVYVCTNCWLVQLPAHATAEELFTPDYAYFSSTSTSWCAHAEHFVEKAVQRMGLGENSHVVELASNDGYLLQYVQQRNIPCLGIEPTRATAEAARAKGIKTLESFFGLALAEELEPADLVVANNVLAHVPDINDFVAGIARLLKPQGQASIEFPHLLQLLKGNQFDTIYHEHYSYLSLRTVQRIAADLWIASGGCGAATDPWRKPAGMAGSSGSCRDQQWMQCWQLKQQRLKHSGPLQVSAAGRVCKTRPS